MQITILPSSQTSPQDPDEHRLVRIPKDLRELMELEIGEFLTVRTKEGYPLALSIEDAHSEDAASDSLAAYVTPALAESLSGDNRDVELVDEITLGCDPEVILANGDDGSVVLPSEFTKKWGAVGHDGALLEFRPIPSSSADVVTRELAGCIAKARQAINLKRGANGYKVRMLGASAYRTLTAGFHLHFGLPRPLLGYENKLINAQIVKALDYYVGMPAIIPEGNSDSHRRTAPFLEYGKPGNFRIDSRTLEYRVPGAALMKSPELARGLLSLGAVVVEDIVNRLRAASLNYSDLSEVIREEDIRALYPNIPPMLEIFRCICNPTVVDAMSHLSSIRRDVEKMMGYGRRSYSIDEFFNICENGIEFSFDLETNWWRSAHGQG